MSLRCFFAEGVRCKERFFRLQAFFLALCIQRRERLARFYKVTLIFMQDKL